MSLKQEILQQAFPDLSDAEFQVIGDECLEMVYQRGEIVATEGDEHKGLMVIMQGEVDVTTIVKDTGEEREEHLVRCFAGDIIGEGVVMDLAKTFHTTSFRAVLNKTLILFWPREAIHTHLRENVHLASKIYHQIARVAFLRLRGPRSSAMRLEKDPLHPEKLIEIPEHCYYGVQTYQSLKNFPLTNIPISHFTDFVVSLVMVKKAAAAANCQLKKLKPVVFRQKEYTNDEIGDAIIKACKEIIDGDAYLRSQFMVDVIQGGAGTSTNMNANEVIANRAQEILGLSRGQQIDESIPNASLENVVHPNDHVNLNQSTNDVYPTAIRLTIVRTYHRLCIALEHLAEAFREKGAMLADVRKMGFTQLQEAVPMTLKQEFDAFATTIEEDIDKFNYAAAQLLEINLGGTAIGNGLGADNSYRDRVIEELKKILRHKGERTIASGIKRSQNLLEASWDTGAFVLFSSILKRVAVKLSKICNDLRLLNSGPRAGFAHIRLPAVQPGSSIMPGKVNPVIPEAVNQVAFQVIGNDQTVTWAAGAGQLQLNPFEPTIAFNIFQSIQILVRAINILTEHIEGIEANREICEEQVYKSLGLATLLVNDPSKGVHIGYDKAASIAKRAQREGKTIAQIVVHEERLLSEKEWNEIIEGVGKH